MIGAIKAILRNLLKMILKMWNFDLIWILKFSSFWVKKYEKKKKNCINRIINNIYKFWHIKLWIYNLTVTFSNFPLRWKACPAKSLYFPPLLYTLEELLKSQNSDLSLPLLPQGVQSLFEAMALVKLSEISLF